MVIAGYDARSTEPILERFARGGEVAAPVLLGGRLWGSVGGTAIPARAEQRLIRFVELVAVAIANAQAWETVTHQAATDPVTGLANHRTFHERLTRRGRAGNPTRRALSLALFDLDHFKRINDTHGHQTGDDTLTAVAHRLAAIARTGELVARVGGEEFAWLMPEITQDGAYLAAERARRAIEATPFEVAGRLTISAGVSSNEHANTAQELLGAADRALYGAKRNGRNTTFISNQTPSPSSPTLTRDEHGCEQYKYNRDGHNDPDHRFLLPLLPSLPARQAGGTVVGLKVPRHYRPELGPRPGEYVRAHT